MPGWDEVERKCAKKCKFGPKKAQIKRQIEVLEQILAWKKCSKSRRSSLAELEEICEVSKSVLTTLRRGAQKRLKNAQAELELLAKIEACTFSTATTLHRSMKSADCIHVRAVQRARKPVKDAIQAAKRRLKRQNMVKPAEIHEVGQIALEQMAESQREAGERRKEDAFWRRKTGKKQRVLKR